jgi:uncharacterized membrane protein YidH (DUF202 family)
MDKNKLIIRKRSSFFSRAIRAIFLIILWTITIYIIAINVYFLLNVYSDGLVTNYLLFNLSLSIYKTLGTIIIVIAIIISIYGAIKINKVKRGVKNHDENNT